MMPSMRERIIIAGKPGQLGNLLILFSHFITYAADKDVRVVCPALEEYCQWFEGTRKYLIPGYPTGIGSSRLSFVRHLIFVLCNWAARMLKRLSIDNRWVKVAYLDWSERMNLDNIQSFGARYCFVNGWEFRGQKSVAKNKAVIKGMFTPVRSVRDAVDSYMEPLKQSGCLIIGVHMRRGDYQQFLGGRYYYSIAQYQKFVVSLKALFGDSKVKFIIFSNDPDDRNAMAESHVSVSPGNVIVDLYCMAECDFIIGPPSTFSTWAAFFGGKPIYFIKGDQESFQRSDFRIIDSL